MKTVFNNRQVCHVFVSQRQERGRNSSGSIFFEGDTIYSYGTHYVMGRIFPEKKLLLVNENSYSPTTAKQRSGLLSAACHYKYLFVPCPRNESSSEKEENLNYLEGRIFEAFSSCLSCHSGITWRIESFKERIKEANLFIDSFSLKAKRIELTEDFEDFLKEILKEKLQSESIRQAKKVAKKEAERKAREKAREAELQEARKELTEWKEGNFSQRITRLFGALPVALRINYSKKQIETSHGAEVPLRDAIKAARIFFTKKEDLLLKRIGHFAVDSIKEEDSILVIGCHSISFKEVERIFLPILEKLEVIQRESEENAHFSPNYVTEFFSDRGVELTSEEVVMLSDNL